MLCSASWISFRLITIDAPGASPRWVAYISDESGRYEVYVQSFPEPRGKWQISTGGGRFPVWGARGEEIFYLRPDGKLMVAPLKLGVDSVEASAPHELFSLPAGELSLFPYEVTPDGQRFLVAAAPTQAREQLSVIVNWPALLKKRAPAP